MFNTKRRIHPSEWSYCPTQHLFNTQIIQTRSPSFNPRVEKIRLVRLLLPLSYRQLKHRKYKLIVLASVAVIRVCDKFYWWRKRRVKEGQTGVTRTGNLPKGFIELQDTYIVPWPNLEEHMCFDRFVCKLSRVRDNSCILISDMLANIKQTYSSYYSHIEVTTYITFTLSDGRISSLIHFSKNCLKGR